MRRARNLLLRLWAAPVSLVGAILSLGFRRRRLVDGVLLAEGAGWPRKLGWRYRAITLGHVVLAVDELDETTIKHEAVHVRQFERWGPLFLLVYPLASFMAMVRGGHHYRDNRYEIAARRGSGSLQTGTHEELPTS